MINFYNYCVNNIDDFSDRFSLMLNVIDRDRCSMQYADSRLYDEMLDCAEDYCQDYNLEFDNFDVEDEVMK